jgi:hypothetical protein
MKILIGILIYLVSLLGSWKLIQKYHSKNGRWSNMSPDIGDFLITILPVLNTLFMVIFLIDTITNQLSFDFSKFFKIKK